ncbi:RNA polymerase sigma factor ShbA [Amycolatopsis sp. NPDC059090]|uniref:RNA polymerase sigma factor ShbA n=1 Tax=unclassified Amycolatopsis TaxID=2618356 RepID=UPI003672AF17
MLERVHSSEPTYPPADRSAGSRSGFTKDDLDPLVAAASQGDPCAVADLLHVLRPMVVRYCRARMGRRDLSYLSADDVAQDALMSVLKALPAYRDRGGSFLYLVHAIAASKIADAQRVVMRDQSEPVSELPDRHGTGSNEPESEVLRLDLASRLQKLIARLAPLQQEILALRIVVGMSANETAETLGISAGNVRVTQHRALAKLRELVHGEGL